MSNSEQADPARQLLPPGPQEIIQLDQGYYILATSALADTRTMVLKQGETFAVFDRYGDILPLGLGEQGVYHGGTRFLSRLELRIGGRRPLLLSSEVGNDNSLLHIDLTNPDVVTRRHVLLPRDVIHIARRKFLWDGACYELLTFRNFGHHAVDLDISLRFAADFRDVFEVRGMKRAQRGEQHAPRAIEGGIELGYTGRDGLRRTARLQAQPAPVSAEKDELCFELHLPPRTAQRFEVQLACTVEEPKPRRRAAARPAARPPQPAVALPLDDYRARTARLWREHHHLQGNSERFNAWHDRSLSDLLMMLTATPHGLYPYAGVPWYSTAFGRDGLITAMQTLWLLPEIAHGVLTYLAAYQAVEVDHAKDAEPGKIMHERREGEMANLHEIPFGLYYGSIDSTLLFLMLGGMYLRRTGDAALVQQLWPAVERALAWIDDYGDRDGDGFVEYAKHSPDGLVQQGWKDSHDSIFHADGSDAKAPIALCEVQGYLYAALLAGAAMARVAGQPPRAEQLERRARRLRRSFARAFWSDAIGTFALALDGAKQPCQVVSSNAGQVLFSGIAGKAHARRCAQTLLGSGSFSGWGVRTVADSAVRYNPMSYHNGSVWPHDNSLIAAGLSRYGLMDGALQITQALFDAASAVDLHRLPELYCGFVRQPGASVVEYPVACAPQAWAAGAVFLCLQACLGLDIDAAQHRLTLSQPRLPHFLHELELREVAVGEGSLDLVLRRSGEDLSLDILRRRGKASVVIVR